MKSTSHIEQQVPLQQLFGSFPLQWMNESDGTPLKFKTLSFVLSTLPLLSQQTTPKCVLILFIET